MNNEFLTIEESNLVYQIFKEVEKVQKICDDSHVTPNVTRVVIKKAISRVYKKFKENL